MDSNINKTIEVVNYYAGLGVIPEEKVDKKFRSSNKQWKKYLELYNDSIEILKDKQKKYIESLKKFLPVYKNIQNSSETSFRYYFQRINTGCNQTSELIKKAKNINDNFDKIFKSITKKFKNEMANSENKGFDEYKDFGKSEEMNKEKLVKQSKILSEINNKRKKFEEEINKISKKYKEIKSELSSIGGMLIDRSIKRNVTLQNSDSPMNIIPKLREALRRNKELPTYKGKNLLKMPKKLNKKIETSMQKVIDVEWKNYLDRDYKFSWRMFYSKADIENKLSSIDELATKSQIKLKASIEFWKKDTNLKEYLESINEAETKIIDCTENMANKIGELKGNDKKLFGFYANILGLNVSLKMTYTFFYSIYKSLDEINKKDTLQIVAIVENKNNKFAEILEFALKALSIVATVLPVIGQVASKVCDEAAKVVETINKVVDTTKEAVENGVKILNAASDFGLIDSKYFPQDGY